VCWVMVIVDYIGLYGLLSLNQGHCSIDQWDIKVKQLHVLRYYCEMPTPPIAS
jgi:hypothetical protein